MLGMPRGPKGPGADPVAGESPRVGFDSDRSFPNRLRLPSPTLTKSSKSASRRHGMGLVASPAATLREGVVEKWSWNEGGTDLTFKLREVPLERADVAAGQGLKA